MSPLQLGYAGSAGETTGSPMGLGRSKHKPRKGEDQKGCICSGPKPNERWMDRHSPDPEKPRDTKPAEGFSQKKGAANQQCPSPEVTGRPEAKIKSSKKAVIPQIFITRASDETLISYRSIVSEEQRTIQEHTEQGPYALHRNPSTIDAYALQTKE